MLSLGYIYETAPDEGILLAREGRKLACERSTWLV